MRPSSTSRFSARGACLLAGLWLLVGQARAADEPEKCELKALAQLDMRTMTDGRVSIPVKFQDRDFFFTVDTGGVVSTIDPRVVYEMKLRPLSSEATLVGVGGVALFQHVDAGKFSIGRLNGKGFQFYIQPASWRGITGTVAPDLMRNYDVDLDFAGAKFNMFSQDHCPGRTVYWTATGPFAIVPMDIDGSGHIVIPVTIDGKEIKAWIDTGASQTIMSLTAAHRYLDFDEKNPNVKIIGSGTQKFYVYPFKTMNFEGISVANPYIIIWPDDAMRAFGRQVILGVNVLRQLHMYIAYKEGKLYLTPATAH